MTSGDLERWQQADVPVDDRPRVDVSVWDMPLVPRRADVVDWWWRRRTDVALRSRVAVLQSRQSPRWVWLTLCHAPRGAGRGCRGWWRWATDTDGRIARRMLLLDPQVRADRMVDRLHAETRRWRRTVTTRMVLTGGIAGPAGVGWWAAVTSGAPLTVAVAAVTGAAGVAVLGRAGARATGTRIIEPVITETDALSVPQLVDAVHAAGITTDRTGPCTVVGVPTRSGSGWSAVIDLPPGLTLDHVTRASAALASALDCPRACLTVDPLPDQSERRVGLHVADTAPSARARVAPDLDRDGQMSVWDPIPVGDDPRGTSVCMSLMWVNTLVGAAPQRGKTTLMRLLASAALLDPHADVIICDGKGGLDWTWARQHAVRWLHGRDTVTGAGDLLDWLETERARRMSVLMDHADRAPQGRITRELAADPALGLRPLIIVWDEIQTLTGAGREGRAWQDRIRRLLELSPAAGITMIAATQNPDRDTIDTGLRRVFLQRVCLSVDSRQGSEVILGTEAYAEGLSAARLGGTPGRAIMWASSSEAGDGYRGEVQMANLTPADAARLADRITVVRQDRDPGPGHLGLVDVVRAAWPDGEDAAHLDVLADRLGRPRSDLAHALRAVGMPAPAPVRSVRPDGSRGQARGYRLSDLPGTRTGT